MLGPIKGRCNRRILSGRGGMPSVSYCTNKAVNGHPCKRHGGPALPPSVPVTHSLVGGKSINPPLGTEARYRVACGRWSQSWGDLSGTIHPERVTCKRCLAAIGRGA